MVQPMDALAALTQSENEFLARADQLTADHSDQPTVCGDWTVDGLMNHVVAGSYMTVTGLTGAPKEEVIAAMQGPFEGDVIDALRTGLVAQAAAVRQPGALEMTVHHPAIDMSGEQLLGFRIVDMTMHAWDLSRSLGFDESMDPDLVAWTWEWLQPLAPFIGTLGMFGTGPSGDLTDTDPLALRLVDLTGRRP